MTIALSARYMENANASAAYAEAVNPNAKGLLDIVAQFTQDFHAEHAIASGGRVESMSADLVAAMSRFDGAQLSLAVADVQEVGTQMSSKPTETSRTV